MKTLKSKLIGGMTAFTFLFGVLFIAEAMEDKPENKTTKVSKILLTDTYFEFTGQPGEESDPTKWVETSDANGCEGTDRACKVKVKSNYLEESGSQTQINTSLLPTMPTVLSPDNENLIPDPAAAGNSPTQPFVDGEIHNRD